MRYLVVSDVHANLAALEAVIADAERFISLDGVWCLGDTVGYGPEPAACIERLRSLNAVAIKGNHDAAAVGEVGLEVFNPYAAQACRWTMEQLTDESHAYLASLETTAYQSPFMLVHGTPTDPLWDYLLSYPQADDAWYYTGAAAVLVGHSHLQFVCREGEGVLRPGLDTLAVEVEEARIVANPGSVGQPRDGDPRAAYAVYDSGTGLLTLHRVQYDIALTQRLMEEHGLPDALITRLSVGR